MSNLQKIKDACQKANPEIMELKFGCRIRSGKSILVIVNQEGVQALYWNETANHGGMNSGSTIYDEILGRPIRLADVLLAIPGDANKDDWFIDTKGDFWRHGHFVFNGWNLKDDNLEHQSEETVNFIAELL